MATLRRLAALQLAKDILSSARELLMRCDAFVAETRNSRVAIETFVQSVRNTFGNLLSTVEIAVCADILACLKARSPDVHALICCWVGDASISVDFSECSFSEPELITILDYAAPHIENINVSGTGAGDAFLRALAVNPIAKTLKRLKCRYCYFTDASASCWISFEALQRLDLQSSAHFTLKTVQEIVKLAQLETLRLGRWEGSADKLYSVLLHNSALPSLRDLTVSTSNPNDYQILFDHLRQRSRLDQFRKLAIRHGRVRNVAETLSTLVKLCPNATFASISSITKEDVENHPDIFRRYRDMSIQCECSPSVLSFIASAENLKSLILEAPLIVPAGFTLPETVRALEFPAEPPPVWLSEAQVLSVQMIELRSNNVDGIPGNAMASNIATIARAFPRLRTLSWNSNALWDIASVTALGQLTFLEETYGWGRTGRGDQIQSSAKFDHPSFLSYSPIDAGTVAFVPGSLPSLKHLALADSSLFQESVKTLDPLHLPALCSIAVDAIPDSTWLKIRQFSLSLTSLGLFNASSEQILQLQHFPNLSRLTLESVDFSSEAARQGISHLKRLTYLRISTCCGFSDFEWLPTSLFLLEISHMKDGSDMILNIDDSFRSLTVLSVDSCSPIRAIRIVNPTLRYLHIRAYKDFDLHVSGTPSLEEFSLSSVPFRNLSIDGVGSAVSIELHGCTFSNNVMADPSTVSVPGLIKLDVSTSPFGDDDDDEDTAALLNDPSVLLFDKTPNKVLFSNTRSKAYRD